MNCRMARKTLEIGRTVSDWQLRATRWGSSGLCMDQNARFGEIDRASSLRRAPTLHNGDYYWRHSFIFRLL